MSRGLILGVGLIALTLLALICIPRHLPVAASDAPRPAFHVSIEHGRLTLTGTVGSEEAKQAAITRAQEAAKTAGLRVSHEIDVAHEGGAAEWEQALPALIAPLTTLQHQQATLSLSDHAVLLKGTASSGEAKSRLLREVASLVGSAVNVQDQVTVATGRRSPSPPRLSPMRPILLASKPRPGWTTFCGASKSGLRATARS